VVGDAADHLPRLFDDPDESGDRKHRQ
jgi:hypothetical protein